MVLKAILGLASFVTMSTALFANEGLSINEIQSAGHISPYDGQTVTGVTGVVTVITDTGFFMQNPDGYETTNGSTLVQDRSAGIFVQTGSRPDLLLGEEVLVNGEVQEVTAVEDTDYGLSMTQISNAEFSVDIGLFDHTNISAVGLYTSNTVVDNDTDGLVSNAADTTFDPSEDGIDYFEGVEGMLVTLSGNSVVTASKSDATFYMMSDFKENEIGPGSTSGQNARGSLTLRPDYFSDGDFNPELLRVNTRLLDGDFSAVNVGDYFSTLNGVMTYRDGNYEVLVTEAVLSRSNLLEQETSTLVGGDDFLSIASYNIQNLDVNANDGDDDIDNERFVEIATHIVYHLNAPDIIAVQEMLDGSGTLDDGITDASQNYEHLVEGVTWMSGLPYAYLDITPENNADGGEIGANSRVGFLYNSNRVALVSADNGAGDATTATQFVENTSFLRLTHNPGRINPSHEAFIDSPKSLAALFDFNGEQVLVINNQWASRDGSTPLFGDVQPPINGQEDQRVAQAEVVNEFVDAALAINSNAHIVVLGDFNDQSMMSPMTVLAGNSASVLTNLAVAHLDEVEHYTVIEHGNAQAWDHIYVSNTLKDTTQGFDIVHLNAEYPETKTRASDRDPLLATFEIKPNLVPVPEPIPGGGSSVSWWLALLAPLALFRRKM